MSSKEIKRQDVIFGKSTLDPLPPLTPRLWSTVSDPPVAQL